MTRGLIPGRPNARALRNREGATSGLGGGEPCLTIPLPSERRSQGIRLSSTARLQGIERLVRLRGPSKHPLARSLCSAVLDRGPLWSLRCCSDIKLFDLPAERGTPCGMHTSILVARVGLLIARQSRT